MLAFHSHMDPWHPHPSLSLAICSSFRSFCHFQERHVMNRAVWDLLGLAFFTQRNCYKIPTLLGVSVLLPLYGCVVLPRWMYHICSTIHPSEEFKVVSSSGLWIKLLWTFLYRFSGFVWSSSVAMWLTYSTHLKGTVPWFLLYLQGYAAITTI